MVKSIWIGTIRLFLSELKSFNVVSFDGVGYGSGAVYYNNTYYHTHTHTESLTFHCSIERAYMWHWIHGGIEFTHAAGRCFHFKARLSILISSNKVDQSPFARRSNHVKRNTHKIHSKRYVWYQSLFIGCKPQHTLIAFTVHVLCAMA